MNENVINNKRIAKNTLLLYVRMCFMMLVSLYTSRAILSALGVEDYGIYNIVGGIVTLFTFVSASLNAAISRFIAYELGSKNDMKLGSTFSSSVIIMLLFSIIVIVFSETIFLWFLNYKLNIPENRLIAANYVLQLSIVAFCINLISVPYNAAIIAHEKMAAYAYISIIEAVGKLLIALMIVYNPIDRLVYFALLSALLSVLIRIIYGFYCHQRFPETRVRLCLDRPLVKKMFSFAGWNLIGAGSFVMMHQGVDILVNLFFGVSYNAARGIATAVSNAAMQLVNNFSTAIKPQIIKSYANGNISYMTSLVIAGAKYSYFLFLFITIPFVFESDYILSLWLVEVPVNAAIFTKLSVIVILVSCLSDAIITSVMATGNVKVYQIYAGGIGMLIFPIVYVAFLLGLPAYIAYIIQIFVFILQLFYRLYYIRNNLNIGYRVYVTKVFARIIPVTLLASLTPILIFIYLEESFLRFVLLLLASSVGLVIFIYLVGLEKSEKRIVVEKTINIFNIAMMKTRA